jgi:hypothetical protein
MWSWSTSRNLLHVCGLNEFRKIEKSMKPPPTSGPSQRGFADADHPAHASFAQQKTRQFAGISAIYTFKNA